jgi:hypothetical protein
MTTIASLLVLTVLLSHSAFASIADLSVKWQKSTIEVCWGTNSHLPLTPIQPKHLNPDETFENGQAQDFDKEAIKRAITLNYNFKNIGIEFIGWENCDKNREQVTEDVVLFLNNKLSAGTTESRASVGQVPDPQKKSFVLIRKLSIKSANFLTPDEHLPFISLHEFGHLLSLRHEDIHPLSPNRRNETVSAHVKLFGNYDPMSLMSYRFMDTLMAITGTLFKLDSKNKITSESTWKWSFPQSFMFTTEHLSDLMDPKFVKDNRVTMLSSTPETRKFSFYIKSSEQDLQTLRCVYIENCEDSELQGNK